MQRIEGRVNGDRITAIVGPTASGKSAAALCLAREWGAEIICADSRQVYRGFDLLTDKPTAEDRRLVPHHLLDVIGPEETFTAGEFRRSLNGRTMLLRFRDELLRPHREALLELRPISGRPSGHRRGQQLLH